MADKYDTPLTDQEEKAFQTWRGKLKGHTDRNPYYDFRGAFKAGYQPKNVDRWPEEFRKPAHPEFNSQSNYSDANIEKAQFQRPNPETARVVAQRVANDSRRAADQAALAVPATMHPRASSSLAPPANQATGESAEAVRRRILGLPRASSPVTVAAAQPATPAVGGTVAVPAAPSTRLYPPESDWTRMLGGATDAPVAAAAPAARAPAASLLPPVNDQARILGAARVDKPVTVGPAVGTGRASDALSSGLVAAAANPIAGQTIPAVAPADDKAIVSKPIPLPRKRIQQAKFL